MNVHPLTHTHFHKYTHRKMARSPIDFSDVYLVYGTCFMRCTNKAMLKINTRDRTRNINYRPIKTESSSVYILGKSLPPRFYSFLFPSFFFRFPSQFSFSVQSVCIACGKISWFSFHCTAKDWKGGKKIQGKCRGKEETCIQEMFPNFNWVKGGFFLHQKKFSPSSRISYMRTWPTEMNSLL